MQQIQQLALLPTPTYKQVGPCNGRIELAGTSRKRKFEEVEWTKARGQCLTCSFSSKQLLFWLVGPISYVESDPPPLIVPATSNFENCLENVKIVENIVYFSWLETKKEASADPTGKTPPYEESWHQELRSAYMQQYVQYMQSLQFIVVQTRPQSPKQARRYVRNILIYIITKSMRTL